MDHVISHLKEEYDTSSIDNFGTLCSILYGCNEQVVISDNPEYHIHIYKEVRKLIKDVVPALEVYHLSSDYQYIIRWFYTQKLYDLSSNIKGWDGLLPSSRLKNWGLHKYLSFNSVPTEKIYEIETILQDTCARINGESKKLEHLPEGAYVKIKQRQSNGIMLEYRKIKFHLSDTLYRKLSNMYIGDPQLFNIRLFNLICKYRTLYCPGYHAGLKTDMFALLQKDLSVEHEAFASPFNVTLSSYSSAYADTDSNFGSSGNFFHIWKKLFQNGGSFELNPPFVEEHMILVAIISEYIMKTVEKPLSLVIIIPSWEDCLAYQMLLNSEYNVLENAVINLERQAHYYQNGSNFDLETPDIRPANGKSSIFILQNEVGSLTYPITDIFLKNFKDRFITAPDTTEEESSGEEAYVDT